MALGSELAVFIIYLLQQLGVVLAVGAELLLLVYYLASVGKERHPAHGHARFAQYAGLLLIIASGAGAVWIAYTGAQSSVLFAPAFLFKWMLVLALAVCALARPEDRMRGWLAYSAAGIEGAAWFALFVVHVVAPVTTWGYLFAAYVVWTAVFVLVWSAFVYILLPKKKVQNIPHKAPEKIVVAEKINIPPSFPKPVFVEPTPVVIHREPAPAPHKPEPEPQPVIAAGLPVVALAELEAPHAMPAPAPAPVHHEAAPAPVKPIVVAAKAAPMPHYPAPAPKAPKEEPKDEGLPAIRVMPRTAEEVSRASVRFS